MIERLPRIVGAYLAACVAAGFALALELMLWTLVEPLLQGRPPSGASTVPSRAYPLLLLTGLASLLAAVHAFVPAVLAIAIAERRGLRSSVYYAGMGAVAAIAAWAILLRRSFLEKPGLALAPEHAVLWLMVGAAGLSGGVAYWCIAGRSAGARRVPQRAKP